MNFFYYTAFSFHLIVTFKLLLVGTNDITTKRNYGKKKQGESVARAREDTTSAIYFMT